MIKNYLKTAWRNLWRNKIFTAINIIGLALGTGVSLVIILFVIYEKSFDDFHTKNIYRLNEVQKQEGLTAPQKVPISMFPMGPTMKQEFPEIVNFTRVRVSKRYQATYGEKRLALPQAFFVDTAFLEMFDFKLLKGDRKNVLRQPQSAVITESTAGKLFGKDDPIGKTIMHYEGDTASFVVTGVVQDLPENSHMQFDILVSFAADYKLRMMNNWGGNGWVTYFELLPGTSIKALENKFPGYLKKYLTENDNWKNYELFLLPLRDIHAKTDDIVLDVVNYRKFDEKYTNIFFVIALVVLIIAGINFMNLSTARSAERAREVGIRKTAGARRFQLGLQFITESVLLSLLALVIAVGGVELFLSRINQLIDRDLSLQLYHWNTILILLSGALAVGILSGLYPALYLSSFAPVKVLKGSVQTGRNKPVLRNALVVIQFASAVFLIVSTIFAVRQLKYMQERDPGFSREQVLTIPLNGVTYKKYDVIKQELLANSSITGVSGAQDMLGGHLDQSGVGFTAPGAPVRVLSATRLIVDHDYLDLYKIPLVAGTDFSAEPAQRGREYIVNETLARELLKELPHATMNDLLGSRFGFDSLGRIVGVARDFNFNSLHHKIETLFLFNQKDFGFSTLSVKLDGSQARSVLPFIESVWTKHCPDQPFEYQFLDDYFSGLYRSDKQVSAVIGILATLAIIISCLGLFGLASYAAERRKKEIGIRRVLGASVQRVAALLSAGFLKYVLAAILVACPLAWLSIRKWLEGYAYRIELGWWVFVLAGSLAVGIALITIGLQVVRAATANPVKSLRNE
ncbi:ABC transporter permease [Niabella beijingensis]|uniref:ABC transporter permease n=1 Tax=Niabella beijingensis TaxID=2872700 RepID=UPI001CC08D06|nr:ABC transporter permease [Niabella beijingensis]MBZ4191478.1 ABC transporter permease [Niabella beijingensis]